MSTVDGLNKWTLEYISFEYEAKDLPQSELIYEKSCEKQSHVDSPKP